MRILHPDLAREYYNSIKGMYPEMSYEQCNEIISAPFKEARQGIESGKFPAIRLQFFGTFFTTTNIVGAMLKVYTKRFKELKIDPKTYFKKKEMLEEYLKKQEDEKI